MFRRQFMQRMTLAGAGGVATNAVAQAVRYKTVTYRIEGFTCIACAVGLETMLRQQKGIVRANASYAKANALIEFDPSMATDQSLRQYISDMGFRVKGLAN